jgi:hypothetical protein
MSSGPRPTKQRRLDRREAERQRAEAARRQQRRWRLVWWGGGSAALIAVIIAVVFALRAQAAPTIDGIKCGTMEGDVLHIHQHLVMYDRGQPVTVPQGIGINESNPATACMFWLHTHTPDGLIHVESPRRATFTLGQFFAIWGQPLSRTRVASARADATHHLRAYVNGRLYRGDPRTIPLTPHARITLEVGPPWVTPPSFTFPQGE